MAPRKKKRSGEPVRHALRYFSQDELANRLGVSERTIRRWAVGESAPKSAYLTAIAHELSRDDRTRQPDFTFVDLFAGIGGLRRGFEPIGGQCLFTCEWDSYSNETYRANFPEDEHVIAGDIREVKAETIPSHDVLLAGFPCQPFSIAGVSKKNALKSGHSSLTL